MIPSGISENLLASSTWISISVRSWITTLKSPGLYKSSKNYYFNLHQEDVETSKFVCCVPSISETLNLSRVLNSIACYFFTWDIIDKRNSFSWTSLNRSRHKLPIDPIKESRPTWPSRRHNQFSCNLHEDFFRQTFPRMQIYVFSFRCIMDRC